jgi:hypothetical protein
VAGAPQCLEAVQVREQALLRAHARDGVGHLA